MPKRRATVDSDDERELDASPNSKRTRTADVSDDEQDARPSRARVNKGKGKARAELEEDQVEDGDDAEPEQGDEKVDTEAFEKRYGATVFKNLEAKRSKAGYGGVADYGIIESIEMHQFMCHKSLSFTFGPNINFIIGGKSAVLSAITVALGGKTASTGRGSGLKSFIREGQQVAEVTIALKNQGDEAYKPEEYGKSIFITRRFTTQGGSTWKIKGTKDGHVVSNKKEELAAICDHMNIQVDNPMNVLTQDAARQFLSTSTAAEKYQFFLRGTQLSQLSTEYETCLENITNTTKVLSHKRDAIPDLEAAFKDAKQKFEEASKAREQKRRVDDLKKELAWAHVNTKQREMEAKMQDAAKQERRLPKIKAEIEKAEAEVDTANAEVLRLEAEVDSFGSQDELKEKHNEAKRKVATEKREIAECRNDRRNIEDSIKILKQSIDGLQQQIDQETQRMAANTQAKRDERQRKLTAANANVEKAEREHGEIASIIRALEEEAAEVQKEGTAKEEEAKALKAKIQNCSGMIQRCNEMEKNRYVAYGSGIGFVVQKINQMNWHGAKPLGPLGEHVKVKDVKKWAPLLRNQLGRYLTAFAVTDSRDHKALKALLNETRNTNVMIIIYEPDLFDYSGGEPPKPIPTVLRALEFSDEHAKRIFINQRSIERMMLGTTRREGEDILRQVGSGRAWTADGFEIRRFAEGGGSTNPITFGRRNDNSELLLTEKAATEKARYEAEKREAEERHEPLSKEAHDLRRRFHKLKTDIEAKKRELQNAHRRLTQAKLQLRAIEDEAQEEIPVDLTTLEQEKYDNEKEKDSLTDQFKEVVERMAEHEGILRGYQKEENALRDQVDSWNTQHSELVNQVSDAATARLRAQNRKQHFEGKLNEEQAKLDAENKIVDELQQEFEQWSADALKYCERVETSRSTQQIQRQIDSVQAALKEREKKQGYTVEETTVEVNKAKAKLDSAKKELNQMIRLNKLLKNSVMERMKRWQDFRLHIALRCKFIFTYNLSQRGYFGNIKFNHEDNTLSLQVQTEDQTNNKAREKEIQALSGGEKSFSTICLLLSLWESIGCPLRCLDEFDVFMDAVNRRISMKMMIDTANQSDKKQYVLITPQDMTNIHIGPTVRVHRMTDPERGQGTLAMAS
ncbi:Structural maintenance of chromosomes protein 6 [Marasmius crinis-equi]|uniref:Structural maintenance of chromosomes protein 6 n=1 Tax=Marasmius crinis-equi TaxID=585013 RepID=A0ABR3FIW1_9AGAR